MLDDKLKEYGKSDAYPFHMPGHKRHLDFPNPYSIDITEIEGFDNLHHADGILAEAQQRAARLYGADRSYYLVNGSTCGLLAVISAAVRKGAHVLAARNCHKSVYHALELREAKPIYIYPEQIRDGIAGPVEAGDVEEALQHCVSRDGEKALRYCGLRDGKPVLPEGIGDSVPGLHDAMTDAAAVIITSPTYDGVVSDIKQIAEVAHRHDVPLIVDCAHGAHFGFSEHFPENPLRLGADAVVVSIHKTLPAFTQTALLHLNGTRISHKRVEEFLDIYETSSPSYVLMAGMERCMRMMAADGRRLLGKLAERLDEFYDRMRKLQVLYIDNDLPNHDRSKILVFTDKSDISGVQLADILRREYRIEVEMARTGYVLALATLMDTDEGFKRLGDALLAIDTGLAMNRQFADNNVVSHRVRHGMGFRPQTRDAFNRRPEQVMSISEAKESARRQVSLEELREELRGNIASDESGGMTGLSRHSGESGGMTNRGEHSGEPGDIVSASYLIPYPPGIPLLVPGERINLKVIEEVIKCRRMGITIEGITGKNTIMIVKSGKV